MIGTIEDIDKIIKRMIGNVLSNNRLTEDLRKLSYWKQRWVMIEECLSADFAIYELSSLEYHRLWIREMFLEK